MTDDDGSLAGYIRSIPDFPSPGIVFRDITPLLASPEGLDASVRELTAIARELRPDVIIGAEARGFLLGPAVAREVGAGFVLARKPGCLPHDTVSANYALEYGTDALELHVDAVTEGARVLVHDDLLATGGTARALVQARRAARRRGRRVRVSHRARVPQRARAARAPRRARAHPLRRGVGRAAAPATGAAAATGVVWVCAGVVGPSRPAAPARRSSAVSTIVPGLIGFSTRSRVTSTWREGRRLRREIRDDLERSLVADRRLREADEEAAGAGEL